MFITSRITGCSGGDLHGGSNHAVLAIRTKAALGAVIAVGHPAMTGEAIEMTQRTEQGLLVDIHPAFLAQQQPSLAPVAGNEPDGALASRIEKGELDALAGDALALEARAAKDPAFRVVRLSSESTHILCRADDSVLREALSRVLRERPADIDATDSRRDEPEPSKGEPARPAP